MEGTDIGLFVLLAAFFTSAYNCIFGFEDFMTMLFDERNLIEAMCWNDMPTTTRRWLSGWSNTR